MSIADASIIMLALLIIALCVIAYLYLMMSFFETNLTIKERELVDKDMKLKFLASKQKISTGIARDGDGEIVVEIYHDPKKVTMWFDEGNLFILKSWGASSEEMEEFECATAKELEDSLTWLLEGTVE